MSIKIEREIIKDYNKKNYSTILSNEDLLYKFKVIINDSTSKAMYSFPLSKRFTEFVKDNSSFF